MPDARQALGKKNEDLVRTHMESLGFVCEAVRLKTRCAELDLIFTDRDGVRHIVEVKSRKSFMEPQWALSKAQRQRLLRACALLQAQVAVGVRCHLALVQPCGQIRLFWDILGEWS